jgi:hypothetical protein
MTQDELIAQSAAEFKANSARRNQGRKPPEPGYSGPLPHVHLPPEIVDEMEAAINEAFEQVDPELAADGQEPHS